MEKYFYCSYVVKNAGCHLQKLFKKGSMNQIKTTILIFSITKYNK